MRDGSERFEYIKQPHVLALIILCVLVIGAAVFTGARRIADINRRASLDTETACFEQVDDADLCRFVAASQNSGFSNYKSVTTETAENSLSITTHEVEKPDHMRSVTTSGSEEISAYTMIAADAYVKDYSDGVWAVYTDPDYQPEGASLEYDFAAYDSPDAVEFRDNYQRAGHEPCGQLTCYKYKVFDPEDPDTLTFLWFDDKDYLIRRLQSTGGGNSINIEYSYLPITIEPPYPTKSVDEQTFSALLGDL